MRCTLKVRRGVRCTLKVRRGVRSTPKVRRGVRCTGEQRASTVAHKRKGKGRLSNLYRTELHTHKKYRKSRARVTIEKLHFNLRTQIVRRCHKRYVESGSTGRRQGSGRPTLRTSALLQTIKDIMQADDEATAVQIRSYFSAAARPEAAVTQHDFTCWTRTELDVPRVLFVRQTKRNALNGLVLTFMTIFVRDR